MIEHVEKLAFDFTAALTEQNVATAAAAIRVPTLLVSGGLSPYLTQRVVDINGKGDAEHDLVHYLRNRIWTDTCNYWHPALRCAIETFGGDRIMLGSDFPIRGPVAVVVNDILSAGLDDATRDAILGGTAQRWFAEDPPRALSNNRL
jgi:aminocarboxymuconate-semialdehyde decarboxylase